MPDDDDVEECGYPACHEPAVGHLVRPFVGDRVALCQTHRMMAVALLEQMEHEEMERRNR